MSVRMTLGLAVLALGATVAALAGIPALIENRSVGDVVVIVGLAVAVVGGVIMLSGIPAHRRTRDDMKRHRQADIDDLYAKRDRILAQLDSVRSQIEDLDRVKMLRPISSVALSALGTEPASATEERAERRALETERINFGAELALNTNELARVGIIVGADARR